MLQSLGKNGSTKLLRDAGQQIVLKGLSDAAYHRYADRGQQQGAHSIMWVFLKGPEERLEVILIRKTGVVIRQIHQLSQ